MLAGSAKAGRGNNRGPRKGQRGKDRDAGKDARMRAFNIAHHTGTYGFSNASENYADRRFSEGGAVERLEIGGGDVRAG